jgi:hypothetical protein
VGHNADSAIAIRRIDGLSLSFARGPGSIPRVARAAAPGAILLAVLALLSGCAGTAKGIKESAYEFDESVSVEDTSRSHADAWVTLRYPAMVEAEAEERFFQAFARQALGGKIKAGDVGGPESERVARGVIAKSNYFAMSLYRELVTQLPPDTVLLSPHLIHLDQEGELASRPVLATETIPSVLTIDFATYSFPDPSKMMNSPPLTFGDVVTPLAVVHSDHWMRPPTNGLLLASTPLLETAWQQSAELALEECEGRCTPAGSSFPPVDFEGISGSALLSSSRATAREVVIGRIPSLKGPTRCQSSCWSVSDHRAHITRHDPVVKAPLAAILGSDSPSTQGDDSLPAASNVSG